jgi:hypothetical protein
MTIYNVLAPPSVAGSAGPDAETFVFVKEGFCWPALFVAPIWLLWRRLWLVFVLYLAAAIGVALLADTLARPLTGVIVVLFAFLVAMEANNLRRWTLERRGYRLLGVVSGGNAREAELRFFASWQAPAAEPAKIAPSRPNPILPRPTNDVTGLFPTPGGLT